jgi:galactokinase
MVNSGNIDKLISRPDFASQIAPLYGLSGDGLAIQQNRYAKIAAEFQQRFSEGELYLFSTPGRTEIGGNHTDHNHGRVLAAAVNLDSIAVSAKSHNDVITLHSDAFPHPFIVDLQNLDIQQTERGTTAALIRGIAGRFKELQLQIGGFNACVTSDVAVGSGLSSSASVEVLIGTILNHLYNDGRIAPATLAQIGQFAENNYFGKPCGLMDQLTCAVGGIVAIDFEDPQKPVFKKVEFDFAAQNYSVLVVNTGGSHADLTDDYAAIPNEMKAVAQNLGKEFCREISRDDLLKRIQQLRARVGDRAILRAWHFLGDNDRVVKQVEALGKDDFEEFLRLVKESGNSSNRWLQNSYPTHAPAEQGVNLALALTEDYLQKINADLPASSLRQAGACRVHGGGFAGTIQVFMPNSAIDEYLHQMRSVFGENAVSVLKIRSQGTVKISF